MIIVNSEFRNKVIDLLETHSFPFDKSSDAKFRYLNHKYLDTLCVQYRELHGRIKIKIDGNTTLSPRNIEYDEDDPKALTNLKSRLSRIVKKEDEAFAVKDKRQRKNRQRKELMNYKIRHFNENKGGHSIVVDPESLTDEYGSLTVYYRSHELNVNMNDDGNIYTNQSLLNTPSKQLSIMQICKIADILVNDFS